MISPLFLRTTRGSLLALSSAMALSLAACGGGDTDVDATVTCGEGTVLSDDNTCVAESTDATCGEGTVEDENGLCVVAEPTTCGEGTTRADDGSCVPADEACSAGTALDTESGRCVPTSEICEDGTVWSDASQRCAPEARCQPGDVILDGLCFPEAEELARDADVTLDAEGKAGDASGVTLELVEGERQVVAGTLGAPVADADGIPQSVKPSISFDGEFGDLVYVSVHDLGLPDAAFRVIGPNGYERFSGNLGQGLNARQLFLTEEGTYTVQIIPGALSGDEERSNAYGGDDWRFVATFERQGQAEPTELSAEQPYTIDLSQPGQNFFRLDADTEFIELELEHIPENYELIAYYKSTTLDLNPQFLLPLAGTEGAIGLSLKEVFPPAGAHLPFIPEFMGDDTAIILDWYHRTPGTDEAQVRVNTPFNIPAQGSVSREVTVKAGEIFASSFQIGAMGIGPVSSASNAGLTMVIKDEADEIIFAIDEFYGISDFNEMLPGYFFERASADTSYTVTLTNNDTEFESQDLMWRLRRQQPMQLGDMVGGRLRQIAYDQFFPPSYHVFAEFSADFDWSAQFFFGLQSGSESGDIEEMFAMYNRWLEPTDDVVRENTDGTSVALNGLAGDYIFSFTRGPYSSVGSLANLQVLFIEAMALEAGETFEFTYDAQASELAELMAPRNYGNDPMSLVVTNAAGDEIINDEFYYDARIYFEEAGTYTIALAAGAEETIWLLGEPSLMSYGVIPTVTFTELSEPEEFEVITVERATSQLGSSWVYAAVRIAPTNDQGLYSLNVSTTTFSDPVQPAVQSINFNGVDGTYGGYVSFYETFTTSSTALQSGLYIAEIYFHYELPQDESAELSFSLLPAPL